MCDASSSGGGKSGRARHATPGGGGRTKHPDSYAGQVIRSLAGLVATAALLGSTAAAAPTDSTPVGTLPDGPVVTVTTKRGQLVAVAMPRKPASTGLVWRLARRVDTRVLRQVSEADVGTSVVVVFRAAGRGRTTVAFALTRGESSPRAVQALRYRVTVS